MPSISKVSLATLGLIAFVGLNSFPSTARGEGDKQGSGQVCGKSRCTAGHECIHDHCEGVNHPKDAAFTGRLHMQTQCAFGSRDCNVCVDNVAKRFTEIRDGFDTDDHVYSFKFHDFCTKGSSPGTCLTSSDEGHFQSVMRFARSKNDASLLAVTRSVGDGGAGRIGVIRMGVFDGSPFPWRGQSIRHGTNKVLASVTVGKAQSPVLDHASGAQMLGTQLFTGVECYNGTSCEHSNAIIRIVDLSNPEKPLGRAVIQLNRHAADAAVARLDDGFLLVAHTQDSDNDWLVFYRSDNIETGWTRIGFWDSEWLKGDDDKFGCDQDTYQNMSLVTQCDGKLFLVGFCRMFWAQDTDWADLFRIDGFAHRDKVAVGVPSITKTGKKRFGTANGAAFDNGTGVYVDPDHRMSFYAIQGSADSDSSVIVNEFSAKRK